MSESDRASQAARYLMGEHAARRNFAPMPEAFAPRSLNDAYDVQEQMETLSSEAGGGPAGYKIAFTTPVMQRIAGFDEPAAGPIYASSVHHSPAVLSTASYGHLGLECEIAFELAIDLPPEKAPFSGDDVAAAVRALMPAFELVDDRHADMSKVSQNIMSIVADGVWNAGAVLGSPIPSWSLIDLAAVTGRLVLNGAEAGAGSGKDVLGHPLTALTWLANMLAGRNKGLRAGMVVLTGSIIALKFLAPGDVARFELEGLGSVSLTAT